MKRLLITVLTLSTFAVGSAFAGMATASGSKTTYEPAPQAEAQKGGLYVAIFGGLNVHQTADTNDGVDLDSETGWFAGAKLGYVIPTPTVIKPVLEVEGFYNGVEAKFETDNFDASSDFHTGVVMVNAIAKFDLGKFQPYIGGGIGYAHVWADDLEIGGNEIDDSQYDEGTFAYQGIAGVEYHVTDKLGVFGEYKALVLDEVGNVETYVNHLVGVGVRFGF